MGIRGSFKCASSLPFSAVFMALKGGNSGLDLAPFSFLQHSWVSSLVSIFIPHTLALSDLLHFKISPKLRDATATSIGQSKSM